MFGNERAFNFSEIKAFENGTRGPITQGECMGAHNTCLHFVGRQNLKLRLLLHHQNLQAEIMFQQLVLEFVLNKLCRRYWKEKRFLREFEAKKEVQVMEWTRWKAFLRIFWIWTF